MLLSSFYLLGESTENSEDFGRLYSFLFAFNALGLIVLGGLIGWNLIALYRQYRRRAVGARLTARLVIMFTVLSVAPVSVVFYYSVQFINRGIDTWFDVRIDDALNDAVTISRSALDQRMKKNLDEVRTSAEKLRDIPDRLTTLAITDMRVLSKSDELTLLGTNGHIIAFSSKDPGRLIPNLPPEEILTQVRNGEPYMSIETLRDDRLGVRILLSDIGLTEQNEPRLLQGLYYMPERIGRLADNVQNIAGSYASIVYLREPLKNTFTFTLFMVSLLSLAFAVWSAFFFAKRLSKPIRDLAEGTRAVAQGDYHSQLPAPGNDDIGLLVRSFNAMTRRLAAARDAELFSQRAIESQRAYLATVLGSLSSGVLTFDNQGVVRTMNTAGGEILGLNPEECAGRKPSEIASRHEHLQGFIDAIGESVRDNAQTWEREITVFGPEGRRVLMCRGTPLPKSDQLGDQQGGNVIVFDDITALVQAQRDSAWGEVARRLAHEIKNPLTPIQLSAERMQHRLHNSLEGKDADILTRSTSTIIQQVEAMKEMVNAFRDYAKPPQLTPEPLDINELIHQVMDLYRGSSPEIEKYLHLDARLATIEVDKGRLRQVLHNLIKNGIEALQGTTNASLFISTHCVNSKGAQYIEIQISDNGPGFSDTVKGNVFEPYVTNKPKGTGLGLAIVKKIIEEHGGIIRAENRSEGGALISIRLPATGSNTGEYCRRATDQTETSS